eukprot:SAG22_NODE_895_length_6635_cov_6.012699_3_plen_217_part_00
MSAPPKRTSSCAAGRYDWEAEKDFLGFHPAAYVDDVANTLLDYTADALDQVDTAVCDCEDPDNTLFQQLATRCVDRASAAYTQNINGCVDAFELEVLELLQLPKVPEAPTASSTCTAGGNSAGGGGGSAEEEAAVDSELARLRGQLQAAEQRRAELAFEESVLAQQLSTTRVPKMGKTFCFNAQPTVCAADIAGMREPSDQSRQILKSVGEKLNSL